MSSRHRLQELLTHPRIWQGSGVGPSRARVVSSGYPSLDRALRGGWPLGSLCELLTDECGLGEFRLLLPALSRLARRGERESGWVVFVNPPYIPYAPALVDAGVDISRVLIARCRDERDLFWTMEQALRSGLCGAMLGWCEQADEQRLRRLQLAAEAAACWAMLLRPRRFRRQRSPAALRLSAAPQAGAGLGLEIIRQRGGRPGQLVVQA